MLYVAQSSVIPQPFTSYDKLSAAAARSATMPYLMSLQRVFTRKSLAAGPITKKRPLSAVRLLMSFEIMLSIERQRAHVAGERPLWRRRVLRHARLLRVRDLALVHRRMCRHGR